MGHDKKATTLALFWKLSLAPSNNSARMSKKARENVFSLVRSRLSTAFSVQNFDFSAHEATTQSLQDLPSASQDFFSLFPFADPQGSLLYPVPRVLKADCLVVDVFLPGKLERAAAISDGQFGARCQAQEIPAKGCRAAIMPCCDCGVYLKLLK